MQKRLNAKQRILVAVTLFGMFFGAGNLIFPVHLGQLAGRNALPAMIGFIITAVGIPILGVAAIGNTHSDGLQALATKVGRRYGYLFTCLLYLTIGPFFAIPRCATTSFTTGIQPMLGSGASAALYLLVFSLAFFALVLFFSLRPAKITVWIGKIINPLFLVFFAVLVIAALCNPGAPVSSVEPDSTYRSGALFSAFIEGYGTMDAIAGLAFGIVVIDMIRAMRVRKGRAALRCPDRSFDGCHLRCNHSDGRTVERAVRDLRKRRHRAGADLRPLSWNSGQHRSGNYRYLRVPQDLDRACDQLRRCVCQNVPEGFFLQNVGCHFHGFFLLHLELRPVQNYRVFPAGAHVPVSARHYADPAGAVRQAV